MTNVPRTPRQSTLDDVVIEVLEGRRTLLDAEELATMQFMRVELEPPIPKPTRMPRATPAMPTRVATVVAPPPPPPPVPEPQAADTVRMHRIPDVETVPYETVDFPLHTFEAEMLASRAARARETVALVALDSEIEPWRASSMPRVVLAIGAAAAAIASILVAASIS